MGTRQIGFVNKILCKYAGIIDSIHRFLKEIYSWREDKVVFCNGSRLVH